MKLDTVKPKYKAQRISKLAAVPTMGCIYRGDTGNSNWVSGLLMQVDKDEATLLDIRGKSHVVILSTLRSLQVTR